MAIEIRHLEHALALGEARNFARAAGSLNLSQSALSRSIQALEKHLGIQLFLRRSKGVEPTEAGELFLRRAEGMVAQVEDLEKDLMGVAVRQQPQLRIGFGPFAAHLLAGKAIARCLKEDGGRRFLVAIDHWANIARRLREGEMDVVVCELSELSPEGLEIVPLESQTGCVVVRPGHPLLDLKEVTVSRLFDFPMVGTSRLPPRIIEPLLETGHPAGFRPAVHCENLSLLKQVLIGSDAVGLAPASLYAAAVRRGELVLIDCLPPEIATRYGLIRLADRKLSGTARDFVRALVAVDRESAKLSESLRDEGWVQDRRPRKAARSRSRGTSTRK